MDSRLQQFTNAQAGGRWDEVGRLLGSYRRGNSGYMRYTESHRECLTQTLKKYPLIGFDYRIQESPYSSEILFTPSNRRWWTLIGEGTFKTASGLIKQKTFLVAYRDGDEWFFTPPPYDNAPSKISADEVALDRKDDVVLRIPSDAPIEVVDLHVHIDPNSASLRNIEFKFRNKTSKKITAYSFVIDDDRRDGSMSVGTGAEKDWIVPYGDSRIWKESTNLFLYRCQGERPIRLTVEDVTFEDATTWKWNSGIEGK